MDSRTKELCETMKIPCMSAHQFQKNTSMSEVISLLKNWDWKSYDENRLELSAKTTTFLEENNLELARQNIL
jgi:hypothetical protein